MENEGAVPGGVRLRGDGAAAVQLRHRAERRGAAAVFGGVPLAGTAAVVDAVALGELSCGDGAAGHGRAAASSALYYGKAIANWLQLSILGIALVPIMVVLYDAGTPRILELLGIILLGAAGLSAPGTFYAAMAAQARSKQTLLPLLLFPLVVPVLLSAVKATSLLIIGDPMGQARDWISLLAAFDAIYWSLCGLMFGRIIEE
jgi:hypothetical protein